MPTIQELEDKKIDLEAQIQEKNKYINFVSDKISEAEGILASYKDKSSELDFIKGEIVKYSELLTTSKKDYSDTNALLISAQRDISLINAQIEQTKSITIELSSLNDAKKELQNKITSLVSDIKSYNETIESTIKKENEVILDLNTKKDSLISDIDKNNIVNKEVINSIERHNEILSSLISDIREETSKKELLDGDVKDLENKLTIAERIIESKRSIDAQEVTTMRQRALDEIDLARKDLDKREGEISFKEKNLQNRTEALRGIKSQLEDIHGKKLNIII